MKKIFFAYGMDDLTGKEIFDGTKKITALLRELNFDITSGRKNDALVQENCSLKEASKIIVEKDLDDLKKCDVLLVDYSIPDRNYVGCTFEMAYAYFWKKVIIVYVGDSGNEKRMFLQYHANHICKNLEELRDILSDMR